MVIFSINWKRYLLVNKIFFIPITFQIFTKQKQIFVVYLAFLFSLYK